MRRLHRPQRLGVFGQLAIIIGCLAIGEIVVYLSHITIPSSIIGMLVLTAGLQARIIKEEWVDTLANFLSKNMGFFFVPPGIALMLNFDVIKANLIPIIVTVIVSTILVMVATGWTHQLVKHLMQRKQRNQVER